MAVQFERGDVRNVFEHVGSEAGLSTDVVGICIDDFQPEPEANGGDLALPTLCGVQAPVVFYADDLDLVSTSERSLEAQLELRLQARAHVLQLSMLGGPGVLVSALHVTHH